jgi:hypothetical protein
MAYLYKCEKSENILCESCDIKGGCNGTPFSFAQNILDNAMVSCTRCKWSGTRQLYDSVHDDECPYKQYLCTLCNTLTQYKQGNYYLHILECTAVNDTMHRSIVDLLKTYDSRLTDLENVPESTDFISLIINGDIQNIKLYASLNTDNLCKLIHQDNDLPLRIAAQYNYLDVFMWLVESGANIKMSDALATASKCGNLEIVKYILQYVHENTHDNDDDWCWLLPNLEYCTQCSDIAFYNGHEKVFLEFCKQGFGSLTFHNNKS